MVMYMYWNKVPFKLLSDFNPLSQAIFILQGQLWLSVCLICVLLVGCDVYYNN